MRKILLIFFLPLFVFAKFQITTYFPLESNLIKNIAQNEVRIKEITSRYLDDFKLIPSSEISRLSSVKAYMHFGLEIEKKYEEILKKENPSLRVIDLSKGINKINNNPYIWTDPLLVVKISENIYKTLCEIDRLNCKTFENNYTNFVAKIESSYLKIKQDFYNSKVHSIFVFDDYWEYFINRFRLKSFKLEDEYLNLSKKEEILSIMYKNNIKKLLYLYGNNIDKALSYSNTLNIQIVEHDIFEDNILLSLEKLSNSLF